MKNMTGRPLPGATFDIIDDIDDDVDVDDDVDFDDDVDEEDARPPNSHRIVIQGGPKTVTFRLLLGPRCKS